MRISVVGTGYLGATHAAAMARIGHRVVGFDVDAHRVRELRSGRAPFHEAGLPELLRDGLDSGRLRFTDDLGEVGATADVHFLCVGTPPSTYGAADLGQLRAALDALLPHLRAGSVLVGKSTVPVGTARLLAERISEVDCDLAWNPEFLREGRAVQDSLHPDRVVVGATNERTVKTLLDLYAEILDAGTPVTVTDYETAELVKLAANAFLATKLSYINVMAEMCEATGADVVALAEALGRDPRIGPDFLGPGLGYGGGCLPKDVRAFAACADDLGVSRAASLLRQVDEINGQCRARLVDLARETCGGLLAGVRAAVLGAAFKPGSDDVRDSAALAVAESLRREGAVVTVYDPRATDSARRAHPDLAYAATAVDAARAADIVLHLTEWPEFSELRPEHLSPVVRNRRIVDGRNTLDPELWERDGWRHRALGRPSGPAAGYA